MENQTYPKNYLVSKAAFKKKNILYGALNIKQGLKFFRGGPKFLRLTFFQGKLTVS